MLGQALGRLIGTLPHNHLNQPQLFQVAQLFAVVRFHVHIQQLPHSRLVGFQVGVLPAGHAHRLAQLLVQIHFLLHLGRFGFGVARQQQLRRQGGVGVEQGRRVLVQVAPAAFGVFQVIGLRRVAA